MEICLLIPNKSYFNLITSYPKFFPYISLIFLIGYLPYVLQEKVQIMSFNTNMNLII